MTTVNIDDLLDVRTDDLDDKRVRQYAASLDSMPPIVVFRIPEGLLVADGYHRVAAARFAGRNRIEAEIREGTAQDALDFVVDNSVAAGIPRDAALAAIKRRMLL